MKRDIDTISAKLKFISFKEFLDYIPRQEIDTLDYEFNTQTSTPDYSIPLNSYDEPAYESIYARKIVTVVKEEFLLPMLISQLNLAIRFKGSKLDEMAERLAVNSLMQFGEPKLLVRLKPRVWLVANPTDFRILCNGDKKAIACFAVGKNQVYRIEKLTEETAVLMAKQLLPDLTAEELLERIRRNY